MKFWHHFFFSFVYFIFNLISFYLLSFYRFFRKVSMVTPIETKQETVRRRPERGSSGDANAWFWIDPTQQRRSRTRLIQIQLAVGRVG